MKENAGKMFFEVRKFLTSHFLDEGDVNISPWVRADKLAREWFSKGLIKEKYELIKKKKGLCYATN